MGRATALLFAREGAKVALNYAHSRDAAEEAVAVGPLGQVVAAGDFTGATNVGGPLPISGGDGVVIAAYEGYLSLAKSFQGASGLRAGLKTLAGYLDSLRPPGAGKTARARSRRRRLTQRSRA